MKVGINDEPVERFISRIDDIPGNAGDKFQNYISGYMPELDGIAERGPGP